MVHTNGDSNHLLDPQGRSQDRQPAAPQKLGVEWVEVRRLLARPCCVCSDEWTHVVHRRIMLHALTRLGNPVAAFEPVISGEDLDGREVRLKVPPLCDEGVDRFRDVAVLLGEVATRSLTGQHAA